MKTCTKCGVSKPAEDFSRNAKAKDGRQSKCKHCCYEMHRAWLTPEKRKAYRDRNRDHINRQQREWRERNKDVVKATKRAWRAGNNAREAEYRRRAYNSDIQVARINAYRKANPGYVTAANAKRHATKLQATPPWLTQAHLTQIAMVYKEASDLGHHVDHIVPLRGKTVCGLHVPWNLQILDPSTNTSKGNRFWPDSWDEVSQLKYMLT